MARSLETELGSESLSRRRMKVGGSKWNLYVCTGTNERRPQLGLQMKNIEPRVAIDLGAHLSYILQIKPANYCGRQRAFRKFIVCAHFSSWQINVRFHFLFSRLFGGLSRVCAVFL